MEARLYKQGETIKKGDPIVYFRSELDGWRPPPLRTVSEWSDENRILLPETSRQPGPWQTETTPYLREIMDAYNDDHVRHLVLCAGTQLGKTESLYNILGFIIDLEPHPTMLIYPRESDCKTISRTRVKKMIEATPALRDKKPSARNRYQTLEQHYPGMILYLSGANSAAALSQKSVRNLLRDEVDKYPERVGKDADPLSLSEERTKAFWDIRKVIDVSSPTDEIRGIWKLFQSCEETRSFHVPCPFCHTLQKLEFENVIFDTDGETDQEKIATAQNTARLVCVKCEKDIGDEHKPAMLAGGSWSVEKSSSYRAQKIGFHLSSLYSPWLSYGDIAAKFIDANLKFQNTGDTGPLQNFINGWLAQPWVIRGDTVSTDYLSERVSEMPPGIVPADTIALTCGFDVQKFGFYYTVWAWLPGLSSHLIDYGFLSEWDQVYDLVWEATYAIQGEEEERIGIWRAAIDTGGGGEAVSADDWSRTDEIYYKLREFPPNVLYGIKGLSKNTSGLRVRHSILDKIPTRRGSRPLPGGLILWLLDTHQLKDLFFWRLKNEGSDPQPVFFHSDTGPEFFAHLTAEERRRNKFGKYEWYQVRKDNHWLDASIYAHACADFQFMGGVSRLPGRVVSTAIKPISKLRPDDQKKPDWINRRGQGWIKRG